MSSVSIIFSPEPDQWGLRGDPFLWRLLEERFRAVELPYQPNMLQAEILRVFVDLIGEPLISGKRYYVEQFAKTYEGMSSGWISGDFWIVTAIHLLTKRLEFANLP